MPILCVMGPSGNATRAVRADSVFSGRGVLVLEDIDLWSAPPGGRGRRLSRVSCMPRSRAAPREAIELIRSAVDNPDVYVLASASKNADIDPFFLELLEPLSLIDIECPTAEERVEIWDGNRPRLTPFDSQHSSCRFWCVIR